MNPTDPPSDQPRQLDRAHQLGRALLYAQARAIDALLDDLVATDEMSTMSSVPVTASMLHAVGVSLHSVLALTEQRDLAIRDCFAIARSAIETAVNAAFISVSGEELAEKAVRHMRQKRWRDLSRLARLGGQAFRVSTDIGASIDDFAGLREAVDEFTNRKGQEIRDWTPESLDERIAVVAKLNDRAAQCLAAATFTIYRPASELIHGTYYGVNHFWQGSRGERVADQEEFDQLWVSEHFVTLLSSLVFGASGAIQAIASVDRRPGHSDRQEKILADMSSLADELSDLDPEAGKGFQVREEKP